MMESISERRRTCVVVEDGGHVLGGVAVGGVPHQHAGLANSIIANHHAADVVIAAASAQHHRHHHPALARFWRRRRRRCCRRGGGDGGVARKATWPRSAVEVSGSRTVVVQYRRRGTRAVSTRVAVSPDNTPLIKFR